MKLDGFFYYLSSIAFIVGCLLVVARIFHIQFAANHFGKIIIGTALSWLIRGLCLRIAHNRAMKRIAAQCRRVGDRVPEF